MSDWVHDWWRCDHCGLMLDETARCPRHGFAVHMPGACQWWRDGVRCVLDAGHRCAHAPAWPGGTE